MRSISLVSIRYTKGYERKVKNALTVFLFLSKNRKVNTDPFIVVYSEEKGCMHSGTAVTNLCFSQPHSLHF